MPLIRIRDVGNDCTHSFYQGEYDEAYVVRRGDLLVGMDGDFRIARWLGPDALLNQRVCRLVMRVDDYHPRFLELVLQGFLDAINAETSSVTVKHLSSRTVQDIPLPKPSFAEQERIVAGTDELLSDIEAGIAYVDAVTIRASSARAAILAAAFSRVSSSPLVPLSSLFKWGSGDALPVSSRMGGPVPVYGGNGVAGWHDAAMESEPTIVVGRVGFYCGNIHVTTGRAWITDNCIYATHADQRTDVNFYAYWLEAQRLNLKSAGTRQKYINQSALKTLKAPLPDRATQARVVGFIEEAISLLGHANELCLDAATKAAVLRQSVLSAAFSGQLV